MREQSGTRLNSTTALPKGSYWIERADRARRTGPSGRLAAVMGGTAAPEYSGQRARPRTEWVCD